MAHNKNSNLEVNVFNCGIPGHNSADIISRLNCILGLMPDTIVLMIGTNDTLNSNNSTCPKDYSLNLDSIIVRLKERGIKVILLTILPCCDHYVLKKHPPSFYGDASPSDLVKSTNLTIKSLAEKHGLFVVDTYTIFDSIGSVGESEESLIRNVANSGSEDGVHPTLHGYQMIALAVYQSIVDHKIDSQVLVCLGDSITYGVHVEGAGTISGQTYPAYLSSLFMGS